MAQRRYLQRGHWAPWEGGFPRDVWYRDGDTVYEGRLVNREIGSYKGYPLDKLEWPDGV